MSDEEQVRHLVAEMYATVSGPAGARDWDRDREVLHPDVRLMRTVRDGDQTRLDVLTLDGFIDSVSPLLAGTDLYEVETGSEVRLFGNVGHVWSSYVGKHSADADAPVAFRGVNSIQVSRDPGGRWWIRSMIWDNEHA